jgi:hypothetical protein
MSNPYQTKIGTPGSDGPAFPATEAGDDVSIFAAPAHWGQDPSVSIVVNLNAASMTPREARQLAIALLQHADSAENAA